VRPTRRSNLAILPVRRPAIPTSVKAIDPTNSGVITMAATRVIEEERGTFVATPRNPHQGYHAGDFSRRPSALNGFARAAKYAQRSRIAAPVASWR
jgi:hypothetical protein